MSADDIRWGRGGGRRLDKGVVLGDTFPAACACTTYVAVEANIGQTCCGCGQTIKRAVA